nr:putative colanic acid biosynthesis acetyltransferase [Rhodococcus opacus]
MDVAFKLSNSSRRLSQFSGRGYDKGRSVAVQALWMLISGCFTSRWWLPNAIRIKILRLFGAHIEAGVLIRHNVRIHWPWKLSVGRDSWIGEGVWILNLEPVFIGRDVCISQEAMICTGSHDRNSPTFEFDNRPITIQDGAWIAARATILRGVTIGSNTTVGAQSLVVRDVPSNTVVLNAGTTRYPSAE